MWVGGQEATRVLWEIRWGQTDAFGGIMGVYPG